MTEEELLLELEEAVVEVGVQIRYEKGDFEGGYCILREDDIIIVNKKLSALRKSSVIAQALWEYGIDNVYLKPFTRTYIEDEAVRMKAQEAKNMVRRKPEDSSQANEENAAAVESEEPQLPTEEEK